MKEAKQQLLSELIEYITVLDKTGRFTYDHRSVTAKELKSLFLAQTENFVRRIKKVRV